MFVGSTWNSVCEVPHTEPGTQTAVDKCQVLTAVPKGWGGKASIRWERGAYKYRGSGPAEEIAHNSEIWEYADTSLKSPMSCTLFSVAQEIIPQFNWLLPICLHRIWVMAYNTMLLGFPLHHLSWRPGSDFSFLVLQVLSTLDKNVIFFLTLVWILILLLFPEMPPLHTEYIPASSKTE